MLPPLYIGGVHCIVIDVKVDDFLVGASGASGLSAARIEIGSDKAESPTALTALTAN